MLLRKRFWKRAQKPELKDHDPLLDLLPEAFEALKQQLARDNKRHEGVWRYRPREGQEERIYERLLDYYLEWKQEGKRIPWLKIMGLAYIAWLRETHPGLLIRK